MFGVSHIAVCCWFHYQWYFFSSGNSWSWGNGIV